jgi:hypothetical protein
MKWVKKETFIRAVGEKYYYAFSKRLLLITDNAITISLKVKDLKTAKQIAELIEK